VLVEKLRNIGDVGGVSKELCTGHVVKQLWTLDYGLLKFGAACCAAPAVRQSTAPNSGYWVPLGKNENI
jgi:hypothetical protein